MTDGTSTKNTLSHFIAWLSNRVVRRRTKYCEKEVVGTKRERTGIVLFIYFLIAS